MEAGLEVGKTTIATDRAGVITFRCTSPLGQAVHAGTRRPAISLPAVAGLQALGGKARSQGKVSQ